MKGSPSAWTVGHQNRNRSENRWDNLLERTRNEAQIGVSRKGGSGAAGVRQLGSNWIAEIGIAGRKVYLGTFDTLEEAKAAYDDMANKVRDAYAAIRERIAREGNTPTGSAPAPYRASGWP